jgi:hypothetical protein
MERFDQTHQQIPALPLFQRSLVLWKVAALFLLIGFGGMMALWIQQKKLNSSHILTVADTIYLTRTVQADPLRIHDTVYITQKNNVEKASHTHVEKYALPKPEGLHTTPVAGEINTLPVDQLDSGNNRKRGSSIKDDTLLQHYTMTTL